MKRLLRGLLPAPKKQHELRRFHPHLIEPFENFNHTRELMTHNSKTLLILVSSFLVGYTYAMLRHNESSRRHMYLKYSNFMILFDPASAWAEERIANLNGAFWSFELSHSVWATKNWLKAFWKERQKL